MLSREERNPLSDWWWTVDRPLLGAIIALMLSGVILSLAASPPVATRIGLDPFHFFNRHVMFLAPSFMVLLGVSFLSPRATRRPQAWSIPWCCCRRPAPRSTSTAISRSAAPPSATSSTRCRASSRWCDSARRQGDRRNFIIPLTLRKPTWAPMGR